MTAVGSDIQNASERSLDVIVLTWNDQADMCRAATSALDSSRVDAHVRVIDNGSEPPAEVPEGCELVRSERNLGVGGGRNLGASASNSDLLCFLDSDAILEPDCLSRLAEAMSEGVAVTAPVFVGQDPAVSAGTRPTVRRKLWRAVGATDRYRRRVASPDPDGCWDVDFVIGACLMVRTDVFRELGGFDDRDLFGPEDLEFCDRVRGAGWRVRQVAAARCHHEARRGHRRILSRRGLRHGLAVMRYYAGRERRAP